MKKWFAASWVVAGLVLLQFLYESKPVAETEFSTGATVNVEMDPTPLLENSKRIGVNLSGWSTWGAEQISANILKNPGFEGDIDRIIVIVTGSDETGFTDEKNWGYDDNYWNGAEFEVRSGASAGMKGKVIRSLRTNSAELPRYFVEGKMPSLGLKDVIVLTKTTDIDPVPIWWIADNSKERVKVDLTDKRPESPGIQSLAMTVITGETTEIDFYLDSASERVGKLLNVEEKWKLSVWAKADTPGQTVRFLFARLNGTPALFDKEIKPTAEWKEYVFDFKPVDAGPPQTIKFAVIAYGAPGRVKLDDIFLGPVQPDPDIHIRHEVIDMLKKLKPSFIRDTQGQLGDSFDNRIADLFARRAVSGRGYAGERGVSTLYSIPDLLTVCKATGANPWIVLPPTFTDEEAFKFGQYMALHADKKVFNEVIVEFGNEGWNWMFRATSIPYPEQLGLVADRTFKLIEKGANGEAALRFAVSGQVVNPSLSLDFLKDTPSATILGIAPYIFDKLDKKGATRDYLKELFHADLTAVKETVAGAQALGKSVAVYEVNLHTTQGDAPAVERNVYTTGMIAGSALSKQLLECMLLKIQPQIVFTLLQYDTYTDNHDFVKLWGIVRDIGITDRMRPQALAMKMLNRVIGGRLYRVTPTALLDAEHNDISQNLVMAAFEKEGHLSAAAINASETPLQIEWNLSENSDKVPNELWVLNAESPFDTNEVENNVSIVKKPLDIKNGKLGFTIPAWGLVILTDGAEE